MSKYKKQRLAAIVGANITALRKIHGWTQIEFAERLGIGADSLSRMERGLVAPRFSRLEHIATTLECSVAELFMTHEDRKKYSNESCLGFINLDNNLKHEIILMAERIIQLVKT